jgi:hypothetical protein
VDGFLSQLGGFQVSRRGLKGEQRGAKGRQGESARGEEKARGVRHVHCDLCSCI